MAQSNGPNPFALLQHNQIEINNHNFDQSNDQNIDHFFHNFDNFHHFAHVSNPHTRQDITPSLHHSDMLLANIKPPQIIQQNAINNTLSSLHGHQSIPPNENVHNFDQNCETDQKSQHKSTRLGDDLFGISQSSYELRYESQLDSEHDISLAFYDNNNLDQNSQNSLPKSQKKK